MKSDLLEETIQKTKDEAAQNLLKTWNCAYSPFTALANTLALNLTEEMKGASIGFAGGISGNRHLCGALWAAVAAVGAYARKRMSNMGKAVNAEGPEFIQANQIIHDLASKVYKRFVEKWGSPNCGDLNPRFEFHEEEQQKKCRAIVRKSVEIALRILHERYGDEILQNKGRRGV